MLPNTEDYFKERSLEQLFDILRNGSGPESYSAAGEIRRRFKDLEAQAKGTRIEKERRVQVFNKINISKAAIELFAQEAGFGSDLERARDVMQLCVSLCQIEAVSPEKDQRIEFLERQLLDVDAALLKAGIYPAKYPSFAEAIEALAKAPTIEWSCPTCSSLNYGDCWNCGNPRPGSVKPNPEGEASIERLSEIGSRIVIETLQIREKDDLAVSRVVIRDHIKNRIAEELRRGGEGSPPDRLRLAAQGVVLRYKLMIAYPDSTGDGLSALDKSMRDLEDILSGGEQGIGIETQTRELTGAGTSRDLLRRILIDRGLIEEGRMPKTPFTISAVLSIHLSLAREIYSAFGGEQE